MYDFTQPNYMYQLIEHEMIVNSALRDCKIEEEKQEVIMGSQGAQLIITLLSFVAGLIACGIISAFS